MSNDYAQQKQRYLNRLLQTKALCCLLIVGYLYSGGALGQEQGAAAHSAGQDTSSKQSTSSDRDLAQQGGLTGGEVHNPLPVQLTAELAGGSSGDTDNEPPRAAFAYRLVTDSTSRQVVFDASASVDNVGIVHYEWHFGDGARLSGARAKSVMHAYPSGEFTVTLTVVDSSGLSSSRSEKLSHTEAPSSSVSVARQVESPEIATVAGIAHDAPELLEAALPTVELKSNESRTGTATVPNQTELPALDTPQVTSPKNLVIIFNGAAVNFRWKPLDTADSYDFRILDARANEVVRVGAFASKTICSRNHCQLKQDIDLDTNQGYSWQVRAHNRRGWSPWSNSRFSVVPRNLSRPKMPLGLYPSAGALIENDESITFLWEHRDAVERYRFQLLDRVSGKLLLDAQAHAKQFCNPTQCAYTRPVTLPEAKNYAWQIQAVNAVGESGWFRTAFAVVASDENTDIAFADFTHTQASDDAMTVVFNGSESTAASGIEQYAWSFGAGEPLVTGDKAEVTNTFASNGSYVVSLRVNTIGGATDAVQQLVNVGDGEPPVVQFLIDGLSRDVTVTAPVVITFDPAGSTSDDSVISYSWDFGDGSPALVNSDGAIVSHSYTQPGKFSVALTVTNNEGYKAIQSRTITALDSAQAVTATEAGRFLSQATFGATDDELSRLMEIGYAAWLDEQFTLKGSAHLDYVKQNSNVVPARDSALHHEIWWQDAVRGKDQLRQRMAFALARIFTLSNTPEQLSTAQSAEQALAAYYDVLREGAFGNYRDLLEAITLNPVMAYSTGMLRNASVIITRASAKQRTRIDPAFAKIALQRFTLGDEMLEKDGTTRGKAAFSERHVHDLSRAFSGWNLRGVKNWDWSDETSLDWLSPMEAIESHHDRNSKTLLRGETLPPDLSAREDLTLALDNLFVHPNVGPFLARQLIQELITSNPSAAYIERVAAVFDNNGVGVRGDLEALLRAILLDAEARTVSDKGHYGRLREPAVRLVHLWRAFAVQSGTASRRGELVLAGRLKQHQLLAPLLNGRSPTDATRYELSVTGAINRQIQRHYSGTPHTDDLQSAYLDFSAEIAVAGKPQALLHRLDRLLLSGTMSETLFEILHEHVLALPDTPSGRLARVRDVVSLIMASPDYLVQM